MKKPLQNILAQNSNNEIAYLCGRCGKEIKKEATVCIHCGAKLGDIRCPFCNFVGSMNDFKYDTCPKCGRKNNSDPFKKKNIIQKEMPFSSRLFWILFLSLLLLLGILGLIFLYNFGLI